MQELRLLAERFALRVRSLGLGRDATEWSIEVKGWDLGPDRGMYPIYLDFSPTRCINRISELVPLPVLVALRDAVLLLPIFFHSLGFCPALLPSCYNRIITHFLAFSI